MNQYDHSKIEKKWQKYWESKKLDRVKEDKNKKKFYALIEFPYPSGAGLHVGHIRSNTAMDIIARKRRREGYNVLYPIGWDAFGLPTENYAIKTGIQPAVVTKQNTDIFRKQLKSLGFSFDWSREINTTDPKYYKWTQWIFLQFFKKGLAYKKQMTINWCPKDLIGLANEEVVNGCCERCGTKVEQKEKEQWMLAITKYAERLDKDLDETDFLEKIKIQQRNWIGKSEGAEIEFKVKDAETKLKVYTTRPDTIFGVTYVVIAPEHPLVKDLISNASNKAEIEKYILDVKNKTDIERTDATSDKTGMEIKGIKVINPANNEEVSVWIADYVLADYGTGIVMAVPAHDDRDKQFAEKYKLSIKEIKLEDKNEMISKYGKPVTKFKLRDWVFSRQRYWGEPIPIVHCEKCGMVAIPEKELPLKLPKVENYAPTGTGESPLAGISKWVNTKCPQCKGKAKRETDTMPQWAGSSWYYLRYMDPKNSKDFADKKNLEYWNQVDWYNGGMEHTTLHLLYSRFWHKFLFDLGLVPTSEPYKKRTSHGMILAEGGAKMSKSVGNVVNPDEIVKTVGADTLRIHEMFMGPFDQAIAWDTNTIAGSRRFIERVWKLNEKVGKGANDKIDTVIHRTIKKVSEDIEGMRFNTAISSMMILLNELEKETEISKTHYEVLLQLLAPFAPHVSEEIWSMLGNKKSIHLSVWPQFDSQKLIDNVVNIVVQVNGKMRGLIECSVDISEEEIKAKALVMPDVSKWLEGKEIKKFIFIKGKLINLVI
jgi:leucyl-tRNA synthetase